MFDDLIDNVIDFPQGRKAKIKTKLELADIEFNRLRQKENQRKIDERNKHNDTTLKNMQLGKYNPKKKNNNENNNGWIL